MQFYLCIVSYMYNIHNIWRCSDKILRYRKQHNFILDVHNICYYSINFTTSIHNDYWNAIVDDRAKMLKSSRYVKFFSSIDQCYIYAWVLWLSHSCSYVYRPPFYNASAVKQYYTRIFQLDLYQILKLYISINFLSRSMNTAIVNVIAAANHLDIIISTRRIKYTVTYTYFKVSYFWTYVNI